MPDTHDAATTDHRVRLARADDAAALAAIYQSAIEGGISTMERGPVDAVDFAARLAALGPRERVLVGGRAGTVDGYGWLKRYSDRHGYRFACETSVYLADAARGSGLADALQVALFEQASDLDYRHVVAKILSVNPRSLAFHARHGFEVVGVQRGIGELGGRSLDVTILQRLLSG